MRDMAIEAAVERARVAAHIFRAQAQAAIADDRVLDPVQRLVRHLLLQELARYRAAGRFPRNHEPGAPTPIFVDAHGTRCAVAHLLDCGGESELVARIARERNRARVHELADEPRLRAWLSAAGLSLAEAAAIQPAYCFTLSECVCSWTRSSAQPPTGVLEGVVVQGQTARVSAIHGTAAGVKVGDEVRVNVGGGSAPPGARVLVPVGGGSGSGTVAVALGMDGRYTCSGWFGVQPGLSLTVEQFVDAVLASNCAAKLASIDPRWSSREGPDCPGDGFGCGVAPRLEGAPTSLGILLALLAVVAGRKRS